MQMTVISDVRVTAPWLRELTRSAQVPMAAHGRIDMHARVRRCKRSVACYCFVQVLSGNGFSLSVPPYAFESPGIHGLRSKPAVCSRLDRTPPCVKTRTRSTCLHGILCNIFHFEEMLVLLDRHSVCQKGASKELLSAL
jgi:hypothetical protein